MKSKIISISLIFFCLVLLPFYGEEDYETLRGVIKYRELPRTMSIEAYLGEEFFLILNDGTELVLWPSETVSWDELYSMDGMEVEVMVEWVEGKVPRGLKGSYPTDFEGNPLPKGEGYRVYFILLIE